MRQKDLVKIQQQLILINRQIFLMTVEIANVISVVIQHRKKLDKKKKVKRRAKRK